MSGYDLVFYVAGIICGISCTVTYYNFWKGKR